MRPAPLAPSLLSLDRVRAVEDLVCVRGNFVRTTVAIDGNPPLHGGRLVVHFPDADLADGAAELASRGFFDTHNIPPWDTWVALVEDPPTPTNASERVYLIAWVPRVLLALAQAGIDANPEECIAWLDDVPAALTRLRFRVVTYDA